MTEEKLNKANFIKAKINHIDEILDLMDGKVERIIPSTSEKFAYKLDTIVISGRYKDRYEKELVPDYLFPAIRNAIAKEKERLIEEFDQL